MSKSMQDARTKLQKQIFARILKGQNVYYDTTDDGQILLTEDGYMGMLFDPADVAIDMSQLVPKGGLAQNAHPDPADRPLCMTVRAAMTGDRLARRWQTAEAIDGSRLTVWLDGKLTDMFPGFCRLEARTETERVIVYDLDGTVCGVVLPMIPQLDW